MRDCSTNRAGFDRVLMAVAATFLTVSATSALAAQSTTPRASAAELAIDAAVPRPEPANVPPPTVGDFKIDTTASVPDAAKAIDKPTEPSPTAKAPSRSRPRSSPRLPSRHDRARRRHRDRDASGCACARDRRRTRHGAGEGREQRRRRPISRSPTDCAKCSAPRRCAISTARASAPRSRSSTRRANTRRSGRRPAN